LIAFFDCLSSPKPFEFQSHRKNHIPSLNMTLRSTVYWGNNFTDGQSVESDEESEETEVESILDESNSQAGPMDVDIEIEEPISHESRGQPKGHQEPGQQTEVREGRQGHLSPSFANL
jgi:hypothetical protein